MRSCASCSANSVAAGCGGATFSANGSLMDSEIDGAEEDQQTTVFSFWRFWNPWNCAHEACAASLDVASGIETALLSEW